MKIIVFEDKEKFEVMAEDNRFLICQRLYTVEESNEELKKWNDDKQEVLKEEWTNLNNKEKEKWDDDFDYWDDESKEAEEIREWYKDENREQPESINENTFTYTIVDLKENIRGADNYYCKFDYSKKRRV